MNVYYAVNDLKSFPKQGIASLANYYKIIPNDITFDDLLWIIALKIHSPEKARMQPMSFADLVKENPKGIGGQPWYIPHISANPAITPEFIEDNPTGINNKPWDIDWLSANPSITPKFIENNLDKSWDMKFLSANPAITPEFIENHERGINGRPWDTLYLSLNPSITPKFIENNLDKPWNMWGLSRNPAITLKFMKDHEDGINGQPWNMQELSANPFITPEFIKDNPDGIGRQPWNMIGLSKNPSITQKFILSNPDGINGPWNMYVLSANPVVTPEFIKANSEGIGGQPWDMVALFSNPSITPKFIIDNKEKIDKRSMEYLSANPVLTPEFIEAHKEGINGQKWNVYKLSENPAITPEFIKDNPKGINGDPWYVMFLSANPMNKPKSHNPPDEPKYRRPVDKPEYQISPDEPEYHISPDTPKYRRSMNKPKSHNPPDEPESKPLDKSMYEPLLGRPVSFKKYFETINSKLLETQNYLKKNDCYNDDGPIFQYFRGAGLSDAILSSAIVNSLEIILKRKRYDRAADWRTIQQFTEGWGKSVHKALDLFGIIYEGLIYKYFFDFMIKNNITPNIPYYFLYRICGDKRIIDSELYSEKMVGQTLNNYLTKNAEKKVDFWRPIFFQIIYSLKCFQEMNIKHNDLHTNNIFIDPDITGTIRYYISEKTWYTVDLSKTGLVKLFDMDFSSVDCTEKRAPGTENIYNDFKQELKILTHKILPERYNDYTQCDNLKIKYRGFEKIGIETRGKSLFDLFIVICLTLHFNKSMLDRNSLEFLTRIFDSDTFEQSRKCRYIDVQSNPGKYPTFDQILADKYFNPIKNKNKNSTPDGVFHLPSVSV